jgi:probable rRNA maturation factor
LNLDLEVQYASALSDLPAESDFRCWAEAALTERREPGELVIRVVDRSEMAALNQRYRHRKGPTNVLSFPFAAPAPVTSALLGDLVICAPVVREEATQQRKQEQAHWAHLIVHGVLHLLGYEHADDTRRVLMEGQETAILSGLGFPDPY